MYQILTKDFEQDDYEVIDYCSEDDLADTIILWKQQFDYVIAERC